MALYWMLLGKIPHMRKWLIMATMYIILTSIALVFWKLFICMPIKRQYDISSGKYGTHVLLDINLSWTSFLLTITFRFAMSLEELRRTVHRIRSQRRV